MTPDHPYEGQPDALPCVRTVLRYLKDLSGKGILTGQHTQTMEQEELRHIQSLTDKLPALVGFELLSYSPNINYLDTDDVCQEEIRRNLGTLSRAWEWARQKGLITFTWHWFSPLYGHGKSFFAENTSFDARRAVIDGTEENRALLSDLDVMAGLLRPFCDQRVPILWRPFHEGDGDWFWWGCQGPETVKQLYRIMHRRFTQAHRLNNLIWVWNSPIPACYPGDDVVDIISRDLYPEPHTHTSHREELRELKAITDADKITLIGEIGSIPDIEALSEEKSEWVSFMTWSGAFCLEEKYTDFEMLKKTYSHPYAITKDRLPILY